MDTTEKLGPFRLDVVFTERVWGKLDLNPWYQHVSGVHVGEAWLTGDQSVVTTGVHKGKTLADMVNRYPTEMLGSKLDEFPLLVKMLFPEEKLSVQVHPDDADAAFLGGNARAKTECWYVLEARPGAAISLGLKQGTTQDMVDAAMGNSSFEELLHQEPVSAGDMIFVEAGTVHAIGAGLVLLEVQQTSDTTYRLYDYGRPRELHLELGRKVIKLQNGSGKVPPKVIPNGTRLIEAKHFVVDRYDIPVGVSEPFTGSNGPECLVGLKGSGVVVCGGQRVELCAGQAVVIPASCAAYSVGGECSYLRCTVPR